MLNAVAAVRGVREVVNRLEVHDEPGRHPALQGGPPPQPETGPFPYPNWNPATKLMVGTAGAVVAVAALKRSNLLLPALGLLGASWLISRTPGDPVEALRTFGERPEPRPRPRPEPQPNPNPNPAT